jgi:hypothetical protein
MGCDNAIGTDDGGRGRGGEGTTMSTGEAGMTEAWSLYAGEACEW